jgi:hypothetical protein
MPRSGGIRRYCREIADSSRGEKLAFIPPVAILTAEFILLIHALELKEGFVIFLTSFLLILSLIELFLIIRETHQHRCQTNFERELAIRLDDFIIERHMDNVSNIVSDFLNEYEEYRGNRTTIYHIACQVMQTHKQELWEKTLRTRLKRYIQKNKDASLRELIEGFVKKYPEYKKDPGKVYQLTAIYIAKRSD